MRAVIINMILFLSLTTFSQESEFNAGNEAYRNENYSEAIESYNSLIGQGLKSTDLYYNLGNAYYRNGELGKSIWAYESALKISPGNSDAKVNLEFTNAQTEDGIDNKRPGLGEWLKGLLFGSTINFWAWLSIFSSIIVAIAMLIFFRTKSRKKRNLGLFLGAALSFVMVFSIVTAYLHKQSILTRSEGIIINEVVEIKQSPLETAKTSFDLKEGTKIILLDISEEWIQVEVNGNSGWILKKELWEI